MIRQNSFIGLALLSAVVPAASPAFAQGEACFKAGGDATEWCKASALASSERHVGNPAWASIVSVAEAGTLNQPMAATPNELASVQLQPEVREASETRETERENRDLVARAYAAWAAGGTRFFDILDDRVTWTILGSGPHAKTYRSKAAFLDAAVAPFASRLSVPLRPSVRSIHADGDDVVILWDGVATRRDGLIYSNTYAWFFTMRDGRVVEVKALLDLAAYDDVLTNVKPAPKP